MFKKLAVLFFVFNCYALTHAQTIKTDVLVIGGTASGVAAAVQCANSKVKTVLAAESIKVGNIPPNEMFTIDANSKIPSGAWGRFRKGIRNVYSKTAGYDTAFNAPVKFIADSGSAVLQRMADTVKNLSLYLNATFTNIKKDGDRWEVNITQNNNKITIKARVIIDATENGDAATKAGAKLPGPIDLYKLNNNPNSYRTAIASGDYLPAQKNNTAGNYPPYPYWCIPINAVVLKDEDNLLITEKLLPADKTIQYLPLQLDLGQGMGTIAAYCAFFKTTTKNLRVRTIQGELLDFKGYVLPFTDVPQIDRGWRAIQQVCATGLLKGRLVQNGNNTEFAFDADSLVNTAEIKPVLTEIYTRAFLWFLKEKPGEKFTIGNTVSLISDYTLTDPVLLKSSLQKAWKTQYKFKLDFDMHRPITRLEFAVLANRFLNPFARTVDLNGTLIN